MSSVLPPGYVYCLCGCGELMFITNEWGYERGYILGHHVKIDMSNRRCSICGSNKTSIDKANKSHKTDRLSWYHINSKLACRKCYKREVESKIPRNKARMKTYMKTYLKSYYQRPEVKKLYNPLRRERYRKKHNIPPERYRV